MKAPLVLSLSTSIESNKKAYYAALQKVSRSNEITAWIRYFVETVIDALSHAEIEIEFTLQKIRFFDRHGKQMNPRQLKVVKRMLDEGPGGFEGGINAINTFHSLRYPRQLQQEIYRTLLKSISCTQKEADVAPATS